MVEFFEKCKVYSSNFDEQFAKTDKTWNLLNKHYQKSIDRKETKNKIPNIFHYIWVGGKIPKIYENNIDDWNNKNPEFKVMIWDDSHIESFLSNFKCYEIYKKATNLGMKSDIARYQILWSHGGVYMDTDFLCLSKDFAELNNRHSFYTGLSYDKDVCFFNGFFACSKGNQILDICLQNLNIDGYMNIACEQTRTLHQTGPMFFTKCIIEYLESNSDIDFFPMPSQLLYPFPAVYRDITTQDLVNNFIKHDSVACHMWHSSWSPNSRFYSGN